MKHKGSRLPSFGEMVRKMSPLQKQMLLKGWQKQAAADKASAKSKKAS